MVAEQFGQREALENRLQVFLRLHHEPLTTGVDLAQFTPSLIAFARAHNISPTKVSNGEKMRL